jgi:membrane-associated protein
MKPMFETLALFGISVDTIIETGGILLIAAVVFAESGLLIGFFLPGDTLLFGAGLYASQGDLSLIWLLAAVVIAAILGDNVGYSIGRRTGHRIFKKKDSLLFKHDYIERAERFYERHGGKTIILARFTPIVRTFAPIVAGVGKMPRRRFMAFNVVGGVLWGIGMPLLGYFVGSRIPNLDKYIELVMLIVIVVSVMLAFGHILHEKENRQIVVDRIKLALRNIFLNKKVD